MGLAVAKQTMHETNDEKNMFKSTGHDVANQTMPETNDEKNLFTDMGQDDVEQTVLETNDETNMSKNTGLAVAEPTLPETNNEKYMFEDMTKTSRSRRSPRPATRSTCSRTWARRGGAVHPRDQEREIEYAGTWALPWRTRRCLRPTARN